MKPEEKLAAKSAVKEKAQQAALDFFHDSQDIAFATIPVRTHRETWRIDSRRFWLWVARTLTEYLKFPPAKALVKEIVAEFEMWALCDGPTREVFVRLAEYEGTTYLDLTNADWEIIEISKRGWRIANESPVKFKRAMGMASLPYPTRGGDPREIVRFLNVQSKSEILLLVWLSYAFRPRGPYPILALSGEQGCGKSTVTKILRSLVDPSLAQLSDAPRDERSLVMSAANSHILSFDNLSEILPAMSDMFCRIATGGAHRERKYYSNDGSEVLFSFQNPVIVNGIAELPQRPDLLDRSLVIHMEPISEDRRCDEATFNQDFEAARSRLFGAMLDVVCEGLRRLGDIKLSFMPRMADFCKWGLAVEEPLGYKPGTFLAAYRANLADANAAALEASPVAWAVHEFLAEQPGKIVCSPARELLGALNTFVELREGKGPQNLARKHPRWPKSDNQFSAEIARAAPNLKKLGIQVQRGRTGAKRFIKLKMTPTDDNDDVANEGTVTDQHIVKQWVAASGDAGDDGYAKDADRARRSEEDEVVL